MSGEHSKIAIELSLEELEQAKVRNQQLFVTTPVSSTVETAPERQDLPPEKPKLYASRIKRLISRLIMVLVSVVIGLHILLAIFQRQLIYLGMSQSPGSPAKYGFESDELREFALATTFEPKAELKGWHVFPLNMTRHQWERTLNGLSSSPASSDRQTANVEQYINDTVILYFPGNAGHRGYRQDTLLDLAELKTHVVIVDYRGAGGSTGSPFEQALIRDARTIYDYLRAECHFNPRRIILFGESLGGGVATQLAAELGRSNLPLGGIILQSSFDSLEHVAQKRYPFVAVSWLMVDKFLSIKHIPDIKCAVLSIHGEQDEVVPFEYGKDLFSAAPVQSLTGIPKEFYSIPLAGHNNVREAGGRDLQMKIGEFIRKVEAAADEPKSVAQPENQN